MIWVLYKYFRDDVRTFLSAGSLYYCMFFSIWSREDMLGGAFSILSGTFLGYMLVSHCYADKFAFNFNARLLWLSYGWALIFQSACLVVFACYARDQVSFFCLCVLVVACLVSSLLAIGCISRGILFNKEARRIPDHDWIRRSLEEFR